MAISLVTAVVDTIPSVWGSIYVSSYSHCYCVPLLYCLLLLLYVLGDALRPSRLVTCWLLSIHSAHLHSNNTLPYARVETHNLFICFAVWRVSRLITCCPLFNACRGPIPVANGLELVRVVCVDHKGASAMGGRHRIILRMGIGMYPVSSTGARNLSSMLLFVVWRESRLHLFVTVV